MALGSAHEAQAIVDFLATHEGLIADEHAEHELT